ncbi:hypothetical protein EYS14_06465 [Alteromonadaceae bacterium M269]|nr:hypothetical protein EYS14_06465 [Alteromonadaceae bacterium M269]
MKKRGRKYHYVRRVPLDIQNEHGAKVVQVSLKTDSLDMAEQRATLINQHLQAYWSELGKEGHKVDHVYQTALMMNKVSKMKYQSAEEIANQELAEILKRSSIATEIASTSLTDVLLGGSKKPELTLSKTLVKYWSLSKDKTLGKSDNQVRKWKNPRIKAVKNFISVIGDKSIDELTRDDVLDFKDWWLERLQAEGLKPASANKDFIHVRAVIQLVSDNLRLDIPIQKLFERLTIQGSFGSTRRSFEPDFVQGTLLNKEKLKDINPLHWLFICAMADTGARISELTGLDANAGEISLDSVIPYIKIQPNDIRKLKTPQSERIIPLVGSSLFAFKQLPKGFPEYATRPDHLSNEIGKWFRENKVLPSPEHTLYSLRHCFQDRLTAIEAPDKIQAELMGHKFYRPKYGSGSTLEQRHKWLSKIAFQVQAD